MPQVNISLTVNSHDCVDVPDFLLHLDLRTQQQRAASSHFLDQIETPVYNQGSLDGQRFVVLILVLIANRSQ